MCHLIDLHLSEGIVDLGGGELDTEGHEGVPGNIMITMIMFLVIFDEILPEGIGINLAIDLEGLEGGKDDVVVVRASGHLGSEQGDHLGEVHGSVHLVEHGLESYHEMEKEARFESEETWASPPPMFLP